MSESAESSSARVSPLVLAASAVAVAAALVVGWQIVGGGAETTTIEIPAGSGERIDSGENLNLIGSRVEFDLGDRLTIVNADDRPHSVGPFVVRAGETFDHTFASPGVYSEACTIHPDGAVTFVVT